MGKKRLRGEGQDYDEVKVRVNLALTPTAKRLLQEQAASADCKSLSDYIEKLARNQLT
ncbi:hypothetical protein DSM106972_095450 [Dulcicalothrix desertica PCC 7102]|uniref:CopG family transcriptional regulator n=1 Tax=Dulcicalothrix desertica PCC 7102 TaxID=232991 RepID=A0A3S1AJW8_9CYAN|nr:hypothetical protein [Dulcicalothrix desertica]RUS93786.1 hypothetical protein DSM106972_095450 [Dulcicalothrix desertica PCC 7102]TWH62735.1 hypothetical protein CAL7102_00252 [Dulcicalothrix desertica PCC 7102]